MATVTFPTNLGGNGQTYTDASFEQGGHRVNFIPVLGQVVVMAGSSAANATAAAASETAAELSATAAEVSEGAAAASAATASAAQIAAANSATIASNASTSASQSLQQVLAAAVLAGAKAYSSYALAFADRTSLTANQVVFIASDETRNGLGAYYTYVAPNLVFTRDQEYYTSPNSDFPSGSIQNVLDSVLATLGVFPTASPSFVIEF